MSDNLHAGIFGPTNCGKTTLARKFAEVHERTGRKCLVLDPYNADWNVSFQCRKMEDFLIVAKKSRNCALFCDEAGQLDLRDPVHEWLLTGARHWGHIVYIIGQSGVQLSPLGRASITRLFLFRSSKETADYWREAFVDDRIRGASLLNRFEFIHAEMFGDVKICKLKAP